MPIPRGELRDAENAALAYGYPDKQFDFRYVPYAPLSPGPHPVVADVEVAHIGGISKTYQADSGTAWPLEFARDVEAGYFGVVLGQRAVRPWDAMQWVSVRSMPNPNEYRVVPEEGDDFVVRARNDSELLDGIGKTLRARTPGGP